MKECYKCSEFVPCYDGGLLMSRGVCTLVKDYPGFVGRNENCVWKISVIEQLSEKEIAERNAKGRREHLRFVAAMSRLEEAFNKLPEWQKHILG